MPYLFRAVLERTALPSTEKTIVNTPNFYQIYIEMANITHVNPLGKLLKCWAKNIFSMLKRRWLLYLKK
jgi:hypothetical protein